MYQGRPPMIHPDHTDHSSILTLDDFDMPASTPSSTPSVVPSPSYSSSTFNGLSASSVDSALAFIALVELTQILEAISEQFFTVKAMKLAQTSSKRVLRQGRQTRLRLVESFGGDLDDWRIGLKENLRVGGSSTATGVSESHQVILVVFFFIFFFLHVWRHWVDL